MCNNCTIVKTKIQCVIKHLGEINIYVWKMSKKCHPPPFNLKNNFSQEGNSFSKMTFRPWINKNLDWLININNYKKKALKRSVSVIVSANLLSVIGLKNPDRSTTNCLVKTELANNLFIFNTFFKANVQEFDAIFLWFFQHCSSRHQSDIQQ